MPIHGVPLLEYWLSALRHINLKNVYVNSHHHSQQMDLFLGRKRFYKWVSILPEEKLFGTAGTIRENRKIFRDKPLLLIHGDNWSNLNIPSFLAFNKKLHLTNCMMTMVTFFTTQPEFCGIVTLNDQKVVTSFIEKDRFVKSNLANGAVYFLNKEIVNWICNNDLVNDFSIDVIPVFLGRILTWHNYGFHRDIGFIETLKKAQSDPKIELYWKNDDKWLEKFKLNPIHKKLL